MTFFEQALAIYRELGDPRGEARAANNVATAYFDLRSFRQALAAGRKSAGDPAQDGKRYGEGIALGILGGAARELAGPSKPSSTCRRPWPSSGNSATGRLRRIAQRPR